LQKLGEFLDMADGSTIGRIPGDTGHGRVQELPKLLQFSPLKIL
jgi:hypothetical protein